MLESFIEFLSYFCFRWKKVDARKLQAGNLTDYFLYKAEKDVWEKAQSYIP